MQASELRPVQMKVKRRVSAPPRPRETEAPIREPRPEVETASAHVTTPAVKPLTNVVRPRAESLTEERLPKPAAIRTQTTAAEARSAPTQEKQASGQPSQQKAVVTTPARATPTPPRTSERQATVQRLLVGTTVDERMTAAGIHVTDLDQKVGLQEMLSTKLQTPGEEVKVAAFLKEMTSTPDAEKLPASSLNLLYTRTDELNGNEGLKKFAVKSLINAQDERDVSQFLDDLKGTDAVQLPADRLAQLYAVRTDVMSKPGLKGFLIKAHTDKQNIDDLNEFVANYKDGAAANLDASELRFLFDQRAVLKPNAGLNDFAVEALSKGESTDSLKPFLAESKDPRVAALKKEQASLLYENYARVKDEPELKEVVISKLATAGDWEAGLNRFLEAIAPPINTKPLNSLQLGALYDLGDDLKATVTDRPKQGQNTNLAEFAVGQFSNEATSSEAMGVISDLKSFGYKGGFLDAARAGAKKQGEQKYNQALQKLKGDEEAAIKAVPDRLPTPPEPDEPQPPEVMSGMERKRQKANIANWEKYGKELEEHSKSISVETNRIKADFKRQREALAKAKETKYVTPEFEKSRQFATDAGFRDDAQWALLKANGDSEQAQILFNACKDTPGLQKFGEWAVTRFAGQSLKDVLSAAKDLGGGSEKAMAAAPYYASCPDEETRQWLKQRAVTDTAADLKFEVGILTGHSSKTLKNATGAIDAMPKAADYAKEATDGKAKAAADAQQAATGTPTAAVNPQKAAQDAALKKEIENYKSLLTNYNYLLKKEGLSDCLLVLFKQVTVRKDDLPDHDPKLVLDNIRNHGIKSADVQRVLNTYGERGNELLDLLKAADPLPKDFASLAEICDLVRTEPTTAEKNRYPIDDVSWALKLATTPKVPRPMAVGKKFVKHVLHRIEGENRNKADMESNDMGHKEWLLVSGKSWGPVTVSNAGYGPNAMTGIFELAIDGTDIQIHNHFYKGGGAQYSLHLKDGGSQGPELTAEQDKSVYGGISAGALAAYTTWVGNKGWDLYTI